MVVAPKAGKASLYAFACLILVGSFIALSMTVAKLADESGLPHLSFLAVAMAGAGLVLLGISRLTGQLMSWDARIAEYGLVSGVLLAIPQAMGFLAVGQVGAGFVSLSFAFPILITWLLAVMVRLERPNLLRFLGVSLGLAAGVLLASGQARSGSAGLLWSLVILAIPVFLAVGNIYRSLRWPARGGPIFLAALMLLGAALALAPIAWLVEAGRQSELVASEPAVWLLLAEVVIFSVLYLFFFILQKLAGPVYLSQIGIVAAVAGTVIAVYALGEATPPNLVLAAVLMLAGSLLFHHGMKRA